MTNTDLQYIKCDRLLIGVRGGRTELLAAIALCRRFDGTVLFREEDVIVVEVGAGVSEIDDLLMRLPKKGVTHLWRSGRATTLKETGASLELNFCGINR